MGSLEMPYWGSVIHVLKQGRTEWRGKWGQYSVIARLVPRGEYVERHPEAADKPTFGEQLRSEQKYETCFNAFGPEKLEIALETIAAGFKALDFDQMVLLIENQFLPDRGETPIDPSDMVDELREWGTPEETIQELLEWERQGRASGKAE